MRFAVAAVAFVAAFHVYSVGNDCFVEAGDDGPALWSVAAKKAVEQSVGTPLDELWKDVYDVVVRQKGSRALRRLRYRVSRGWLVGDGVYLCGVESWVFGFALLCVRLLYLLSWRGWLGVTPTVWRTS